MWSGKIPFSNDKLNIHVGVSQISPKQFFMALKLISSYPALLFILRGKRRRFVH